MACQLLKRRSTLPSKYLRMLQGLSEKLRKRLMKPRTILQRSSSEPQRVRCSGLLSTRFRHVSMYAAEKGQRYAPFYSNRIRLDGKSPRRMICRLWRGLAASLMQSMVFRRTFSGWFLSKQRMWLGSREKAMFLRVNPIVLKNSLLAGSRDFSKACSRVIVFFLLRSSSITFRLISSLETDQRVKPGWSLEIIQSRVVFPVEGMETGMSTITFLPTIYLGYLMLPSSTSSLLYSLESSGSSSSAISASSAAVELTISKNFSLVIFFSTSRMKSMNLLCTKREMGLDWSRHSSKLRLASSTQASRGRLTWNSRANSEISLVNFLSRLSQPLLSFWMQTLSFSRSLRQMRYSMVLTLQTSRHFSPVGLTPLTQTTLPQPPSRIVCQDVRTTVTRSFSTASSQPSASYLRTLAAGRPYVSKNLQATEVGWQSSVRESFSTSAQKYSCGCLPQSTRCCKASELQYSPISVLLDSSI